MSPSTKGIQRTVLPSGLRVVTETMPEARSVSTGFWVGVGGRDEPDALAGASHFLEHLVFKGTDSRPAKAIAEAVDAVGGEMNAFTAREQTVYYTRLPAEALAMGLELLCDVLSVPALRPTDVDAEREVILEELALSEDTPDDVVHTRLAGALFPDHPLGREVLGDESSIEAMTSEQIREFFEAHYVPSSVVVVAAGRLEHTEVVDRVSEYLADRPPGNGLRRERPLSAPHPEVVERRPTEQVQLALGWRALPHDDPDRYALAVGNQVLGGGMASRLFQEIREERGLVYSVCSSMSPYSDAGALVVYAGTSPERVDEVIALVDEQVDSLATEGVRPREMEVALGYLTGSLLLGEEDSASRMHRLGRTELALGTPLSVDDQVGALRAVTAEDVHRALRRVLDGPRSLAIVGPR